MTAIPPRQASPDRRACAARAPLLVAVLLAGCSAAVAPSYSDPTPQARIGAIRQTNASGNRADIPHLVECLAADDPAVRLAAITTLERLTGTTLGYRYDGSAKDRRAKVETWKAWVLANPQALESTPAKR